MSLSPERDLIYTKRTIIPPTTVITIINENQGEIPIAIYGLIIILNKTKLILICKGLVK